MDAVKVGDQVKLTKVFRVFRIINDNMIDICDSNGNCLLVTQSQILKLDTDMKAMKDAVQAVAKNLLKANNSVTTLEIKTELRRDYPYYYWDQQTVSNFMSQLSGDGVFDYTDNGTFRTYRIAGTRVNHAFGAVAKTTTGALAPTGVGRGIAKVAGTVPSQPQSPVKRTRPVRRTNLISHWDAVIKAGDPNFQYVTLKNGKTLYSWDIRGQKKTPVSYVSRAKTITSITVANKTFKIK